jgi:hypothetical protein
VYVVPTLSLRVVSAAAPPPEYSPMTDDRYPPAPPPPPEPPPPPPPATTMYSVSISGEKDVCLVIPLLIPEIENLEVAMKVVAFQLIRTLNQML